MININIFEIKKWEWDNYMQRVMGNVNLKEISMKQKNKIEFIFSNSFNGNDCNRILVSNIIKLDINYDSFMNEGFPYFILDIYICSLSDEEIKSGLSYYRYGFPSIWNNLDLKENIYLLTMIGSDISIEILCEKYEITKINS